ncbi:hypothetical protein [Chitinimonas sp.]|uniref:hypothetical protein n=1 Tax=Chitinimonas sp. TaxID=1934313 RepID=UPI0035B00838
MGEHYNFEEIDVSDIGVEIVNISTITTTLHLPETGHPSVVVHPNGMPLTQSNQPA